MRLAHQEVNEEQGVREAMMAVGDSGSCIQAAGAAQRAVSTIAKFLDTKGPGIQQMAYRVTDVEAGQRDPARALALRLLYDEPRRRHLGLPDQLHPPPRTPAACSSSWWSLPRPVPRCRRGQARGPNEGGGTQAQTGAEHQTRNTPPEPDPVTPRFRTARRFPPRPTGRAPTLSQRSQGCAASVTRG